MPTPCSTKTRFQTFTHDCFIVARLLTCQFLGSCPGPRLHTTQWMACDDCRLTCCAQGKLTCNLNTALYVSPEQYRCICSPPGSLPCAMLHHKRPHP